MGGGVAPRGQQARRKVVGGYNPREFPPVAVTVDLVVLTIREQWLCALLVKRAGSPFQSHWALPGGFVRPDETLDAAAARELQEETGLRRPAGHLEQLRSYGDPERDPRMRVVTIAYLAMLPALEEPVAGTDAAQARFWPVETLPALAFDHQRILADGVERARSKLEYTSLATAFCAKEFTLADLRGVYEVVWGVPLDPANFRRKVLRTPDFVVATGRLDAPGRTGGRPAELYRGGSAATLQPPLIRP
ncbi:MAG: NUDIX hydrolase [Actinomycetota bacterium]